MASPARPASVTLHVDEDLLPLEVGTITVDEASGRLTRATRPDRLEFGFRLGDNAFEAVLHDADGHVGVTCTTTIGRLPYSVEDRKRRSDLHRVLTALKGTGLTAVIDRSQAIRVSITIRLAPPVTVARLVGMIVEALLPVQGYLTLLVEVARRPKPAAAPPATTPNLPAVRAG